MQDPLYIVAVDAAYEAQHATVACVAFTAWRDADTAFEVVLQMPQPAPYVPGEFYKRELPCIERILQELPARPTHVLIDGYVWLDEAQSPGLGGHLWRSLSENVTVVGVAKTPYRPLPPCVSVLRGASKQPLYVSAAGMSASDAAARLAAMHGRYRVPTLLRRVDQLSRGVAS